ncbi:hypothetical protein P175DRAFT_0536557, partial [Aspergillus ochraceoroseus IBT 24754]
MEADHHDAHIEAEKADGILQDWHGGDDKENPRNWSTFRKTTSTVIVCLIGAIQCINYCVVVTTLGVLARAGLWTYDFLPLSETFGRKLVYLLTPLADIFTIGVGQSRNIASLIACRFVAGLFAAPGISVAAATITDYTPPSQRVIPLGIYYSVPSIGSAMGPLIGSFVVEHRGWRWTAWTPLMMAAVLHPPALFLKESYKPIILQRRARMLGAAAGLNADSRSLSQGAKEFITSTIVRPLH